MAMIDCPDCGKHRVHRARGRCASCYAWWTKNNREPVECRGCHETRPHVARGLCDPCYAAWHKGGEGAVRGRATRLATPKLTAEVFAVEWPHMLGLLGEQGAIARLVDAYPVSDSFVRNLACEFGHEFQKVAA